MAITDASDRAPAPAARRTIVIRGQVAPPRRPARLMTERAGPRPDRVAMWAFVMGIFLVLVAMASGNA
jgi:hypothetical protein